jgi:hypothetical protein
MRLNRRLCRKSFVVIERSPTMRMGPDPPAATASAWVVSASRSERIRSIDGSSSCPIRETDTWRRWQRVRRCQSGRWPLPGRPPYRASVQCVFQFPARSGGLSIDAWRSSFTSPPVADRSVSPARHTSLSCRRPPSGLRDPSQGKAEDDGKNQQRARGVDLGRNAKPHQAVQSHGKRGGARASGQARNDKIVEREHEGQGPAGKNGGKDQRQGHQPERLKTRAAEIEGCFFE